MRRFVWGGGTEAGKSSQAQRIAQQLGLQHISSGDLLREHKASDTPLGRYMRENWYENRQRAHPYQRWLTVV